MVRVNGYSGRAYCFSSLATSSEEEASFPYTFSTDSKLTSSSWITYEKYGGSEGCCYLFLGLKSGE